jgi:hypothetical protein
MTDFAVEKLDAAFTDLQSMLPAQWQHTGDNEVECQPNWNFYRQMEANQAAFLVIAREDGRPIGYMTAFVYPHPNAVSVLTAEIRTYYVERNRVHVLNSMIDFTLEELARRGVFKISAETSAMHSAGRIWELKGFTVAKIGYSLKLKPAAGAKYA